MSNHRRRALRRCEPFPGQRLVKLVTRLWPAGKQTALRLQELADDSAVGRHDPHESAYEQSRVHKVRLVPVPSDVGLPAAAGAGRGRPPATPGDGERRPAPSASRAGPKPDSVPRARSGILGARCPASAGEQAPVAQRIEHLTTDQKVRGSNPFGRAR